MLLATHIVKQLNPSIQIQSIHGIREGFASFAAAHQAPSERFNVPPPDALPSGKRRRLFRDVVAFTEAIVVDNAPLYPVNTNTDNTHQRNRPSLPPIITGTDTTTTSIPTVSQLPRTNYMWLHLSRLAKTVTVDQVVSMVKSQLDTTDVIAFSLLKAGTTISSVSSLTFKVRIIAALRDKALTAGSWPVGLGVREFISLPQRPSHHRPDLTNTNTPIPVRHSPIYIYIYTIIINNKIINNYYLFNNK